MLKVLVVDDDAALRLSVKTTLASAGSFEIEEAFDGVNALEKVKASDFNMVILDVDMPRMNGLELTQSIRAWNDKSKTPIVMITSRTTNKHRELAKKAGNDGYVKMNTESIAEWTKK